MTGPIVLSQRTISQVLPDIYHNESKGQTTVDVKNLNLIIFKNVGAVTVTNLTNAQPNQRVLLLGDGYTTIQDNAQIVTNSGSNELLSAYLVYEFVFIDLVWRQVAAAGGGGGGGGGDVTGPASSTDNAIARYDGTTGKIIQNSTTIIEDTGVLKNSAGILVGPATTTQNNVNDSNFAAETLYIDSVNERVGMGTDTPEATLSIHSQGTGNTRGVSGRHWDNTTAFSQFKYIGGRARGTVGSPSAVLANDTLVSFNARGYKATDWSNTVGGMYIYAAANWTDTSTETYFTWRGVATGAGTTVSEWMKLTSAGRLLVNTSVQTPLVFNTGALLTVGTTSAHTLDFQTNSTLHIRVNGAAGGSFGATTFTQGITSGANYGANFGNGYFFANSYSGADPWFGGYNNNVSSGFRRSMLYMGSDIKLGVTDDGGTYQRTALNTGGSRTTLFIGSDSSSGTQFNSVTIAPIAIYGASTSSRASFRVPHGTAPTSPTNGDFWSTTAGFYGRVNGTTVGPFAAGWTTQAAVADATGGTVQDSEARTALNSLLAKLRTINIISP